MDMINKTMKGEVGDHNLQLQECCDIEQLYKLLGNWSKSCGMATVIVDRDGNQLSEDFGMTKFCKTVQSCEKGLACCMKTWKSDVVGIYHTVDIATGNYSLIKGTGMERTVEVYKKHSNQAELVPFHNRIIHPSYLKRFRELVDFECAKNDSAENGYRGTFEYPIIYPGDDEFEWHEINVFVDTEEDGTRIANILGRDITEAHNAQVKNEKELRAAADKNRILSELTKMLYSYNLTLNLRTGKYSMIIGTGMTKFMEIFRSTDDYETAYNRKLAYLAPENVSQFAALASLDTLRARTNSNGFIGNLEYVAFTDYGEEWHEINVFISTDEDGEPVANILGRDITDAHKRHEKRENLQKAAMARDQLLSGITKMLYSYNFCLSGREH
ncbi:MAG: PocR ligand-binding domain-containing protein [Oscillospiraceae bacterium]|nr:PocR ligand-binding domain-containing protein [Oscillospiraceae bacterium]